MNLSVEHNKKLISLYGALPNGKPRFRIVTPSEARRPHGTLKGQPKYFDPASNRQMPFLVVEQWMPADIAGDKEYWNYELLGPHPSECHQDCCNGGVWSFFMPLHENGRYIPFEDSMMEAVYAQIRTAIRWKETDELSRFQVLEAERASANKQDAEKAWTDVRDEREHYLNHKEELDNADNRVTIGLGKNTLPDVKGGKESIGRPNVEL